MFIFEESDDPAVVQAFKDFTSKVTPELSLWSALTSSQFRHFVWTCVNHCPRKLISAWSQVTETYVAPEAHPGSLLILIQRLVSKLAYVDRAAYVMLKDAPAFVRVTVLEQLDPLFDGDGWFDRHVPTLELLVDTLYELASVAAREDLLEKVSPKFAVVKHDKVAQVVHDYVVQREEKTDKSRRSYDPNVAPWILEQFLGELAA